MLYIFSVIAPSVLFVIFQSALLCGVDHPVTLKSDSSLVLSGLNATNSAAVIIQNPLETERYLFLLPKVWLKLYYL